MLIMAPQYISNMSMLQYASELDAEMSVLNILIQLTCHHSIINNHQESIFLLCQKIW